MRLFPPISFVMFFKHLNRFMYIFSPLYTGRSYIRKNHQHPKLCSHQEHSFSGFIVFAHNDASWLYDFVEKWNLEMLDPVSGVGGGVVKGVGGRSMAIKTTIVVGGVGNNAIQICMLCSWAHTLKSYCGKWIYNSTSFGWRCVLNVFQDVFGICILMLGVFCDPDLSGLIVDNNKINF